jgi:hypothetical protein
LVGVRIYEGMEFAEVSAVELHEGAASDSSCYQLEVARAHWQKRQQCQARLKIDGYQTGGRVVGGCVTFEDIRLALAG